MRIIKGLKYRIYPNKQQRIMVNRTLGCSRFIYNYFLRIRMDEWNTNKYSVQYAETASMLKDLKKCPEYIWLKEVDSTALQQSLRDLYKVTTIFSLKEPVIRILSPNIITACLIGANVSIIIFAL